MSNNQLVVLPDSIGSLTRLRCRDGVMSVVLLCFSVHACRIFGIAMVD